LDHKIKTNITQIKFSLFIKIMDVPLKFIILVSVKLLGEIKITIYLFRNRI